MRLSVSGLLNMYMFICMCMYMCVYMYNKHFYNLPFEKRFYMTYSKKKDFIWLIYNKANTIKSRTNRNVNIKSMIE